MVQYERVIMMWRSKEVGKRLFLPSSKETKDFNVE